METCPDCEYVEKQVEGNPNFEVIDIGKHVRNLKQFLDLRDSNPAFEEAKKTGDVGIGGTTATTYYIKVVTFE